MKRWQFALCQHPMWLIIDQDSECRERTPPWGAENVHLYAKRLLRNLEQLDRYPCLKINFDTSGVELEDIAERFPALVSAMKKYTRRGQVTFLNGSYSQPHFQILDLESTIRQFEYGLKAYRQCLGAGIDTYAAQEVGITEQMPQILKAFGFEFSVVPHFSWAITFLDPHELIGYEDHVEFVHGREFVQWTGIDGSRIPLYLTQVLFEGGMTDQSLAPELCRDLYGGPPIKAYFPDLIEVESGWVERQIKNGEFILLDRALKKRIRQVPPDSQARFYTYWSYVEGVEAEALSRANAAATARLIQAEIMEALIGDTRLACPIDFRNLWKTVLKCQHHDAFWVGAPQLRAKSIRWLNDVKETCLSAMTERLRVFSRKLRFTAPGSAKPYLILHTYPGKHHAMASIPLDQTESEIDEVRSATGRRIPCQAVESDGQRKLLLSLPSQGVGYQVVYLCGSDKKGKLDREPIKKPLVWQNRFYRARVHPDGTFSSLVLKKTNHEMLRTGQLRGNELRGQSPGGGWITSKDHGSAELIHGAVADIISIEGAIGNIPYSMDVFLYHQLPWLDVRLLLQFNGDSIGSFTLDETKLNLYWPFKGQFEIYNGIGGGVTKSLPERPILAVDWIALETVKGSVALRTEGTFKHWVRDGVLASVLGWGGKGNDYSNRRRLRATGKEFDFRLKGDQEIRYSLHFSDRDIIGSGVPDWAMSQSHPPVLTPVDMGNRQCKEPPGKTLVSLPQGLIASSIRKEKGKRVLRLYSVRPGSTLLSRNTVKSDDLKVQSTRDLEGKDIDRISPFQIAEIGLERKGGRN